MPCWEVQTTSIEFKAEHLPVLKRALDSLKLPYTVAGAIVTVNPGNDWTQIRIDLTAGQAKYRPQCQDTLNRIKRAYSLESIKTAAKQKGWQFAAKTETAGTLMKWS